MRHKRAKAYRKLMGIYSTSFGFREPYQILVDSSFVTECLARSHNISDRLADVMQGKVKIMISQCCMQHLYNQGKSAAKAINTAKSFERRKCNHWETKETEAECIRGLIGDNNHARYGVATQSLAMRNKLRKVPGVPLIYLSPRSVVILEPPSEATIKQRQKNEKGKLQVPPSEVQKSKPTNQSDESIVTTQTNDDPSPAAKSRLIGNNRTNTLPMSAERMIKKRRRESNPNPLSVKKKKRTKLSPPPKKEKTNQDTKTESQSTTTAKRRRRGKKSGSQKNASAKAPATT